MTVPFSPLENLTIVGNEGGSSGHGIHLIAADATVAFLVCYRDVSVMDCKQHNIFHDGNVFESQLYNVRSTRAGGCAFKGAANDEGLPGETRFFGGTYNASGAEGIRLEGGGTFSLHGVTCSNNENEGVFVYGCGFSAFDLQLELNSNSDPAGNQATIEANSPVIVGCTMTVAEDATGNGIAFVNAIAAELRSYRTNSSIADPVHYCDVNFDNGCHAGTVTGYLPDDYISRVFLGASGGHEVRSARRVETGQSHAQILYPVTNSATTGPDAVRGDSFLFDTTSPTLNIGDPERSAIYHNGQRITITVYNNSGGALTVNWGADYLKSAFTAPANAKRKSIMFEWQNVISKWVQIGSASADL